MRIINGLSDEDRLIFLLRQLGELQFKQIASALEIMIQLLGSGGL